jgi:hypothetical protein
MLNNGQNRQTEAKPGIKDLEFMGLMYKFKILIYSIRTLHEEGI